MSNAIFQFLFCVSVCAESLIYCSRLLGSDAKVGMLFMDLQVDPLQAFIPLLLQLPIFWGLYRAIRRLAIVQYEPLQQGWLWIPSTYGPGLKQTHFTIVSLQEELSAVS